MPEGTCVDFSAGSPVERDLLWYTTPSARYSGRNSLAWGPHNVLAAAVRGLVMLYRDHFHACASYLYPAQHPAVVEAQRRWDRAPSAGVGGSPVKKKGKACGQEENSASKRKKGVAAAAANEKPEGEDVDGDDEGDDDIGSGLPAVYGTRWCDTLRHGGICYPCAAQLCVEVRLSFAEEDASELFRSHLQLLLVYNVIRQGGAGTVRTETRIGIALTDQEGREESASDGETSESGSTEDEESDNEDEKGSKKRKGKMAKRSLKRMRKTREKNKKRAAGADCSPAGLPLVYYDWLPGEEVLLIVTSKGIHVVSLEDDDEEEEEVREGRSLATPMTAKKGSPLRVLGSPLFTLAGTLLNSSYPCAAAVVSGSHSTMEGNHRHDTLCRRHSCIIATARELFAFAIDLSDTAPPSVSMLWSVGLCIPSPPTCMYVCLKANSMLFLLAAGAAAWRGRVEMEEEGGDSHLLTRWVLEKVYHPSTLGAADPFIKSFIPLTSSLQPPALSSAESPSLYSTLPPSQPPPAGVKHKGSKKPTNRMARVKMVIGLSRKSLVAFPMEGSMEPLVLFQAAPFVTVPAAEGGHASSGGFSTQTAAAIQSVAFHSSPASPALMLVERGQLRYPALHLLPFAANDRESSWLPRLLTAANLLPSDSSVVTALHSSSSRHTGDHTDDEEESIRRRMHLVVPTATSVLPAALSHLWEEQQSMSPFVWEPVLLHSSLDGILTHNHAYAAYFKAMTSSSFPAISLSSTVASPPPPIGATAPSTALHPLQHQPHPLSPFLNDMASMRQRNRVESEVSACYDARSWELTNHIWMTAAAAYIALRDRWGVTLFLRRPKPALTPQLLQGTGGFEKNEKEDSEGMAWWQLLLRMMRASPLTAQSECVASELTVANAVSLLAAKYGYANTPALNLSALSWIAEENDGDEKATASVAASSHWRSAAGALAYLRLYREELGKFSGSSSSVLLSSSAWPSQLDGFLRYCETAAATAGGGGGGDDGSTLSRLHSLLHRSGWRFPCSVCEAPHAAEMSFSLITTCPAHHHTSTSGGHPSHQDVVANDATEMHSCVFSPITFCTLALFSSECVVVRCSSCLRYQFAENCLCALCGGVLL